MEDDSSFELVRAPSIIAAQYRRAHSPMQSGAVWTSIGILP